MIKLNNKGITVVELILTFSLLIVLVLGMFNVIVEIKTYSSEKQIEKELIEFKSQMIYEIQNDLIKNKATGITTSTSGSTITSTITFENINKPKTLIINLKDKTITYDNIKYEIPQKNMIEFVDPWNSESETNHNIEITQSNDIITIDVPYFIIGKDTNYGFKIVHPINL